MESRNSALLFPGVKAVRGIITGADETARLAVVLAEEAFAESSFGVGGLLIDRSGNVYAQASNSVISNGALFDPTAHAERQLVDWFFDVGREKQLHAEESIIVTSVDPCAMCAGLLLLAGLRTVALANDAVSGIHGDGWDFFAPPQLQQRAQHLLSFFRVRDAAVRGGAAPPDLLSDPIEPATHARAVDVFEDSLERAQTLVGRDDEGASRDYGALPALKERLVFALPATARLAGAWLGDAAAQDLGSALAAAGDAGSVLVDDRGIVLLAVASAESSSPARSSVIELARAYTMLRQELQKEYAIVLPHPRGCSVVQRTPNERPAALLRDLGAIGSFMELPRFDEKLPALAFLENPHAIDLKLIAATLPSLYTKTIKVTTGVLSSS